MAAGYPGSKAAIGPHTQVDPCTVGTDTRGRNHRVNGVAYTLAQFFFDAHARARVWVGYSPSMALRVPLRKQIRERLHKRLRLLKLLVSDPARYSAEKYAGSSAMYLSAVMPGTWREDVGLSGETKGSETTEQQERA